MSNNGKKVRKDREVHLDVTEKEYQQGLAKGIQPAALLKPGRHTFRRVSPARIASREDAQLRNIKVRVNIHLDLDVVNYFKARAARPHAAPYQTQINEELRGVMERDAAQSKETEIAAYDALVKDENFINAVAEQVGKRRLKRA
jgi:uncharacterized protein (DUF4415 family)